MKIRIQFSKHGAMKFIGHLDTMRYFQKAIRRSGIDITYTTGYSPHQVMAFAAPLGVGIESDSEYVDIEVNSVTSSEDFVKRLDETMAEGFRIIDIRLLPDNTGNAMASVAAAGYLVNFRNGRGPEFDINEAVKLFNEKEHIAVTKQTKKSESEIDIRPGVYELSVSDDGLYMLVDASSSGNIKPELVVKTLFSFYGSELKENALMITRLETYGRDKNAQLIPLIEFGDRF